MKSFINHVPEINFEDKPDQEEPETIYKNLIFKLKTNDIDIYKSIIYNNNIVSNVKLTSPQLEQFHLCQNGHFTIPGERIRRLYKNGY